MTIHSSVVYAGIVCLLRSGAGLFRAEAFNLTNTPFFLPPGINLGSPDFGVVSDASGERQVQFTLRLTF